MASLAHVDLGYNQIESLPDTLAQLPTLKILYLNDNKLPYLANSLIGVLPNLDGFKIEPNLFDIPEEARKEGIKAVQGFLKRIAKS